MPRSVIAVELAEQAAPGVPGAGLVAVYAKSDGKVYCQDDAGTEYDLTGGGGAHSHAASEVTTGTFGTGEFTFPGKLNVAGTIDADGDLIQFPDTIKDDKLVLFTGYQLGIASATLKYQAPATKNHRFYIGTEEVVSIDNAGLDIVSGNDLNIESGSLNQTGQMWLTNGWFRSQTSGYGWYSDATGAGIYSTESNITRTYQDEAFRAGTAMIRQYSDGSYGMFGANNLAGANVYQIMCRSNGLVLIRATNDGDEQVLIGTESGGWELEVEVSAIKCNSRLYVTGGVYAHNDWYRIVGTGGIYNESSTQGIYFPGGEDISTYGSWSKFISLRHDQIGSWSNSSLISWSTGGGSGARITFHADGQNAAPLIKSWGADLEVRNQFDDNYTVIRAAAFNPSRSAYKRNIQRANERLAPQERRMKLRRIEPIHFHRPDEDACCANCHGTGRRQPGQRSQAEAPPDDPNNPKPLVENGMSPQLSDAALLLLAGDLGACPSCHGDPSSVIPAAWRRQEQDGWFGIDVDELVQEFPEVIGWKEDYDGSDPYPEAIDLMGVVAILWEEIKENDERLDVIEAALAERKPIVGRGPG